MKKAIALLLALVMVFALCACGAEKTPAKTDKPAEPAKWPSKPVTIYCTNDVGSPIDNSVRIMADYLAEVTGVDFKVENDSTGGGARLASLLYDAEPDGHTLLFTPATVINSYLDGYWEHNLADPESYTIIASGVAPSVKSGCIMLTGVDQPFNNMAELKKYVEENPNTISVGAVAGTIYESRLKAIFKHFKIYDQVRWVSCTTDDLITGLLGGTITIGMQDENNAPPYSLDGSMKCLISTRSARDYDGKINPDYVSVIDAMQILPDADPNYQDMEVLTPLVYIGPAGMSQELVDQIHNLMIKIRENKTADDRIKQVGGPNTYEPWTQQELIDMITNLSNILTAIHNS